MTWTYSGKFVYAGARILALVAVILAVGLGTTVHAYADVAETGQHARIISQQMPVGAPDAGKHGAPSFGHCPVASCFALVLSAPLPLADPKPNSVRLHLISNDRLRAPIYALFHPPQFI